MCSCVLRLCLVCVSQHVRRSTSSRRLRRKRTYWLYDDCKNMTTAVNANTVMWEVRMIMVLMILRTFLWVYIYTYIYICGAITVISLTISMVSITRTMRVYIYIYVHMYIIWFVYICKWMYVSYRHCGHGHRGNNVYSEAWVCIYLYIESRVETVEQHNIDDTTNTHCQHTWAHHNTWQHMILCVLLLPYDSCHHIYNNQRRNSDQTRSSHEQSLSTHINTSQHMMQPDACASWSCS